MQNNNQILRLGSLRIIVKFERKDRKMKTSANNKGRRKTQRLLKNTLSGDNIGAALYSGSLL